MNRYAFKTFFITVLALVMYAKQLYAQPATCTATIGTPANGASHYISISWATVGGATAYELEVSDNGTTNWNNIYNGSATTYSHNTGNLANTPLYYRVRSISGTPSAYTNATQFPIFTACDEPALPQLSNATPSGLSITLPAETPVPNPANTTYSIFCTTTGQYVQANGTLGVSEVFQTRAAWGTVAVTGLGSNTNYCFYSKARNEDGDVRTAAGATLLATETFATNANFSIQNSTGPTNRFWSPGTCGGGGLVYSSTEGCPAGSVGFSGAWNNFWGCFLRTPEVNCTGNNTVTLTFDVSHSYTASTPNNNMRIYFYADGAYTNNAITSLTINGVNALANIGGNGLGISYTEIRACGRVEATFNISSVSNKSNILFYIDPKSNYNNSQPFYTWIDNVGISGSANATACLSTTSCTAPSLQSNPGNQSVCVNGNASFTVNATGGVSGYQWQENSGSGFVNLNNGGIYSNVDAPTLNLTGANSNMNGYQYRCVITAACGNNLTSNAATLTVNTIPASAGNINGDDEVCTNSSATYTVATINGATSYSWVLPAGASITNGSGTNTITVAFGSNAQPGNIYVEGVNTCGPGIASAFFGITVNTVPNQLATISGVATVCGSATENYTVPLEATADSYTWILPAGATISSVNNNTVEVLFASNAQSGNITVAGVNSCGTGPASTPFAVTVNTAPAQPAAITGNATLCATETAMYEVPLDANAVDYTWAMPSGFVHDNSTTNVTGITVGSAGGTMSVTANNSCGSSQPQTFQIDIVAAPQTPNTIVVDDTVCAGTQVIVEVLPAPATGVSYQWNSDWGTATIISNNSASFVAGSNNTVIEVVAVNTCGEASATVTKTVSVYPLTGVTFNFNDNPICNFNPAFELTQGTPSGGTYSGVGVNASGFFSPSTAGVGETIVTYTLEENGCTYSDTALLSVEICPGIENTANGNSVNVFPNPFSNSFSIAMLNAEKIIITDVAGKVVLAKNLNTSETKHIVAVNETVVSGMYVLYVTDINGKTTIKKLVKE